MSGEFVLLQLRKLQMFAFVLSLGQLAIAA